MKGFGIPVSNWQEELKLEESRAHTRRRFFFVYFCEKENCGSEDEAAKKSFLFERRGGIYGALNLGMGERKVVPKKCTKLRR